MNTIRFSVVQGVQVRYNHNNLKVVTIIELDDEEEPVVVGSDEQGSEVSFPKMFAHDLLIWKLRIRMTWSTTVT